MFVLQSCFDFVKFTWKELLETKHNVKSFDNKTKLSTIQCFFSWKGIKEIRDVPKQ